jgi:hypothetical protein
MGGYLRSAATFSGAKALTIAPGERADVLVDFSGLSEGTKVLLVNTAAAPFPGGDPAANIEKELVLELADPLLGVEDFLLVVLQFGRQKPFRSDQRLLADIVGPGWL